MKPYGSFCPVSKGAEVFAERWTPLIVRELLSGSHRFSEIENGVPGVPKALLSQRLRSLETAGVVQKRLVGAAKVEYHLTDAGLELEEVVMSLGAWGQRWAGSKISPEEVDPGLLMWDMHRRIHLDRLPDRQIVVEFDFIGVRNKRFWLVLDKLDPSVCFFDPGFDIDLLVTADTLALHQVWMGQLAFSDGLRLGSIKVEGPSDLVGAFPSWLALNSFAGIASATPDEPMDGAALTGSRLPARKA